MNATIDLTASCPSCGATIHSARITSAQPVHTADDAADLARRAWALAEDVDEPHRCRPALRVVGGGR